MKFNKIYSLIAAALCLVACENDPFFYQDVARVRMEGPEVWTLGTDSLLFSFASYSSTIQDTTFDVTVYIMGDAEVADRTAVFEVGAKTTAETTMYSFPETLVIPAGAYSAVLPVTINRADALKNVSVALDVEIVESADFKVGINAQNHLLIRWSDILSKPSNWDDLEEFFGEYSLVKYQFIIDTLNMGEFDTDELTWAQMKNYQITVTEALRVYNEEHPGNPLQDEDGNPVTF